MRMLFSNRKKGELVLILDVESTSVNAILVMQTVGERPMIRFTYSGEVIFREGRDGGDLIEAIIRTVTTVIDETQKYIVVAKKTVPGMPGKVSSIHYVLSSPWILSESKRLEEHFSQPKKITEAVVRSMVHKERNILEASMKVENKVTQIEEKLFDIELNGYSVADWRGKKALSLSVSFVTSISGIRMTDIFKSLAKRRMRVHKIHFHSSLLLQHIGIRRLWNEKEMYVIVHVHGEITDVMTVHGEACIFFGTFPTGMQTIVRSVAKEAGVGLDTAASMVNLHTSGVIGVESQDSLDVVKSNNEHWVEQLQKSLQTMPDVFEGSMPIIVATEMQRYSFAKILSDKFPNARVEQLSTEDMDKVIGYDPSVTRSVTASIYTLALEGLRQ